MEGVVFVLAGVLLIAVLPIAAWLIKNSPQDLGMLPFGKLDQRGLSNSTTSSVSHESAKTDTTFKEALVTSFFWKLTFGYFV